MLLFRSFTTGLLGTCVVLLLVHLRVPPLTLEAPPPPNSLPSAVIVDVAPQVEDLTSVLRLGPGEHVIAVDDRPVLNDLAAGAAIAANPPGSGRYLDLTIATATGPRRMLILMH